MKKQHPPPYLDLHISHAINDLLQKATWQHNWKWEDWEIAAIAIREWCARNDPTLGTPSPADGYQWKQLFLPNGTLLRTIQNKKKRLCVVQHDNIFFEDAVTTPSRFANSGGGANRNAWRVIWVLFPNTSNWRLAADLRPKKPASRRTSR